MKKRRTSEHYKLLSRCILSVDWTPRKRYICCSRPYSSIMLGTSVGSKGADVNHDDVWCPVVLRTIQELSFKLCSWTKFANTRYVFSKRKSRRQVEKYMDVVMSEWHLAFVSSFEPNKFHNLTRASFFWFWKLLCFEVRPIATPHWITVIKGQEKNSKTIEKQNQLCLAICFCHRLQSTLKQSCWQQLRSAFEGKLILILFSNLKCDAFCETSQKKNPVVFNSQFAFSIPLLPIFQAST